MDINYSETEIEFRDKLISWLDEVLPEITESPGNLNRVALREYDTAWQKKLFEAGYAGVNWPKEYGGQGLSPTEQLIFLEETTRRGAPYVGMNFVGLLHAGPTIIACGSDEQKAKYLPPILSGYNIWCQGFSEPNAGSDLASLSTKAHRDGDVYVVNGQKIWTSYGDTADYCELLVRTNPDEKHAGISWLICPMNLSGIDIRPIKSLTGSTEFCEVFFEDVKIPVENLVGEENAGWKVAMVTFSFERGTAFISEQIGAFYQLEELARLANELAAESGTLDAGIKREIGELRAAFLALWALTKRNVSQAEKTGVPGPGGSVFKLYFGQVKKSMCDLALRILGEQALYREGKDEATSLDLVTQRIYTLSLSIAAGTSQIQRNIIGERILGLPK